jgi:pantoate--beta-alanine ligase
MKQVTKAAELTAAVEEAKRQGLEIGLVPTMGALHEGHLSLIERALKENDVVVVSLFVNPIQFNNKEDLEKYPRTIDADLKLIEGLIARTKGRAKELLAFTPTVDEMYPDGEPKEVYHFGPVEEVMEGPRRPGHFSGVAVVVRRLFDLAQPKRAYFGEKDYQQIAVIREMCRQCRILTEVIPCPIVREPNGLAMSSRNRRLSEHEFETSANIHRILEASKQYKTAQEIKAFVESEIAKVPEFQLDYFELADAETLLTADTLDNPHGVMGFITVYVGPVRLIDNVRY